MDGSEQILAVLMPILQKAFADVNPGRFGESLLLLFIAWWRVKAMMTDHLTKIEVALGDLSKSVREGFQAGEQRFTKLEYRVDQLEYGKLNQKTQGV